jgi:hypothetical protein
VINRDQNEITVGLLYVTNPIWAPGFIIKRINDVAQFVVGTDKLCRPFRHDLLCGMCATQLFGDSVTQKFEMCVSLELLASIFSL